MHRRYSNDRSSRAAGGKNTDFPYLSKIIRWVGGYYLNQNHMVVSNVAGKAFIILLSQMELESTKMYNEILVSFPV